jgi:Uncharacterized protein conserved in bacteria
MDMQRFGRGLLGLILYLACSMASVMASEWPEPGRSIQAIVPAQAGLGVGNTIARAITDALSEQIGNRIVLQNFTSSTNLPSMLSAIDSNTDGYTLLFATVDTLIIEPELLRTPALDPLQHFTPIGLVAEIPHILVVNNELPAYSLQDLTQHLAKYPGVVHFGSSGNGSAMHLAGESYMSATSTNMVHVPYSAAEPATNNLMSGDIQVMFQVVSGVLNFVRNDRMRALAVMSDKRSTALPDVPSMAEAGYPALKASKWYALLAPRGTPRHIIEQYNTALNTVLASPELQARLLELGAEPLGGTPEDLQHFISEESEKWGRVIREAHLPPR